MQNLGFLSTSMNMDIASSFKDNIIYEIKVPMPKTSTSIKQISGFADISEFSDYCYEK